MQNIFLLQNVIQDYAWGSATAIPDLMGKKNTSGTPQAELWMGAHPKASSMVKIGSQLVSLADLIKKHPQEIIGKSTAAQFNNQLPYLLKVLAAAEPLSIQAHPNLEQARQGFERENRLGIPLDDPQRNYRDDNHKPECLCALGPFWALNGFRKIDNMLGLMAKLNLTRLTKEIDHIKANPNSSGLKAFFQALMTMSAKQKLAVLAQATAQAAKLSDTDPAFQWILRLNQAYPQDIGALAPLFLNLVCLKPGEAIFLKSGELHSYLEGIGIELMANSDNVLRGGLTAKHIDVAELLGSLNFEEKELRISIAEKINAFEWFYPTDAEEFRLSKMKVKHSMGAMSVESPGVEIMLCTEGAAVITDSGNNYTLTVNKGASVIVSASATQYRLAGRATLYKASVPYESGTKEPSQL
ncbi:mannose-6-phosphate isomerase, class I [Desulfococcaceae bacterium HSG7]|nr:mannose-6-phosphate isomerase, class I [Desulfococcaceae bacterium HSG7]